MPVIPSESHSYLAGVTRAEHGLSIGYSYFCASEKNWKKRSEEIGWVPSSLTNCVYLINFHFPSIYVRVFNGMLACGVVILSFEGRRTIITSLIRLIRPTKQRQLAAMDRTLRILNFSSHDDVMAWKRLPHYWPFVRGIHRSPVDSHHEGSVIGSVDVFSVVSKVLYTDRMPVI